MTENIANLFQPIEGDPNLVLYGLFETIAFLLVIIVGAYLIYRYYPKIVEVMAG